MYAGKQLQEQLNVVCSPSIYCFTFHECKQNRYRDMSFVNKAYLSLSGSVLLVLLNFFIGIILARALAPDGLGQYSLAISFVTILGVIASLGMGDASIYYINNRKRDSVEIVQAVVKTSFLLAVISIVATFLLFQNGQYFGAMTTWGIIFVAVYSFGVVLSENLIRITLAFMRIGQFVAAQIVPAMVFLLLIFISYFGSRLTTVNAWLFISLGQVVGVLMLLYFLRDFLLKSARTRFNDVVSLAKYGSMLNMSYVALLLNNEIGLFLVRQFTTNFNEVGFYRLAIRLAGVLLIIPKSLGPLFFSKWSKTEEDIRVNEVERVSRIFCFLTLAGILVFEIIAEKLITIFYGVPYLPAVPVLRVILVGIGARFLMMPIFNLFSSSGRPLFSTYSLMAGLLVAVIFMCILIPPYNGVGAGMAFAIGNTSALIICYYLASNKLGLDLRKCFIIKPEDLRFVREKILVHNR